MIWSFIAVITVNKTLQWCFYYNRLMHKYIHSLVFSLRGCIDSNQSPVMWPMWLWHAASRASTWG
jgi:hypothetical protein